MKHQFLSGLCAQDSAHATNLIHGKVQFTKKSGFFKSAIQRRMDISRIQLLPGINPSKYNF